MKHLFVFLLLFFLILFQTIDVSAQTCTQYIVNAKSFRLYGVLDNEVLCLTADFNDAYIDSVGNNTVIDGMGYTVSNSTSQSIVVRLGRSVTIKNFTYINGVISIIDNAIVYVCNVNAVILTSNGGTYQDICSPTSTPTPTVTDTPTPAAISTVTPTPTYTPVPTSIPWSPPTPVPLPTSICPSCDYYLPLIYQNSEVVIHQNSQILQKLDTVNFNLANLHADLTGLNTTLLDLSTQQQTQHQALLAAIATMDARQYSPPYYTETITTPAGLQVVTRYTVTDAGSEAQLQLSLLSLLVGLSWLGYSVFKGRL